jgi:hypothetical protein
MNFRAIEQLRKDKVVILVHLVCVDIIGHVFKTFSPEYYEEVSLTDSLI